MNGVASGFRSSACSTTPEAASADPTSAPASTRGRRATKKICASALSAKGIDESKTRQRLIDVEPMSGATRHTSDGADAEQEPRDGDSSADVHGCGSSVRSGDRNDRQVAGPRIGGDVNVDAVEFSNQRRVEHDVRWASGEHATAVEKNQIAGRGWRPD